MSPLRKQMQDAMVLRGLAARTQESYIAAVAGIAKHYRRSPDMLSSDEVERNLLHLIEERKLSWSTTNQAASALMFLYGPTLKRKEDRIVIPRRKVPAKQPEILSREEVARILEACSTVRQHTLLMTTYAAGLRLWADICPSVTPAVPCATSITRAATATARSARRGRKRSGSRDAGASYCRCRTSIWSLRCPMRLTVSLPVIRACFTSCCSARCRKR